MPMPLPLSGKPWLISTGPAFIKWCGTAVAEDKLQLVEDVHQFPGHIACDSASNSEIVIPIHKDGTVWGVLDIDSPYFSRFTEADARGLQRVVEVLEKVL